MKLSAILAVAVLAISGTVRAGVTLAREGKTDYVIGVRAGASAVEWTAAKELQTYLGRVTGAGFEVKEGTRGGKVIEVKLEEGLEADAIRMKVEGERVVLSGGTRGVLYAVNTFLEDVAGVRWWTSTEEFVPRRPTLVVTSLERSTGVARNPHPNPLPEYRERGQEGGGAWEVSYSPRIRYRENLNADVMGGNYVQAARLKLNGHHQGIPAEWGGHYSLIGWCHTSFDLVPPGEHFATHPEWYAEREGKRQTSQVCWSDEGMRREMGRRVLAKIRRNPGAGMISVSQEDAMGECQCATCAAITAEEGSAMGPLLRGVNAVAAEVGKEYPNFLVETLAYQWSRKPTRVTRPAKNVLIRLCSIEADFAHPLEGQDFGADLREWSKIADHLFVWNYVTNFSNYLIPQPNLNAIGKDLRFFAENHVVGVFEQGDAFNNPIGDFLQMRVWAQAKLMWEPTRDQRELMKEFLDGYYGAAGEHLLAYLDLVNERSGKEGFRRGCYHAMPAMTGKDLARAEALFGRAAEAVKGDPVLEKRVAVQRLIVDHVRLLRWDFEKELKTKGGEQVRREFGEAADRFIREARANGVRNFSESLGFDGYVGTLKGMALRAIPAGLPGAGAELPAGSFDVQEDGFYLFGKGDFADVVEDGKASNGRAARMRGGHTEWAVQLHVAKGAGYAGNGPWRCVVVARVEGKQKAGHAFTVGVYGNATGMRARREVGMEEAGGGEYKGFAFVMEKLEEGEYFWVSPGGAGAVWVDRVFIERGE